MITVHRMILKSAAQQIRAARAEAEASGEEWEGPEGRKSSQKEYDMDALRELRQKKRTAGDDFRTARRKLASNTRTERKSEGRMKIEWSYEPGELVKIKNSAFRRFKNHLENMGLFAGAVGVIVENEDDVWRSAANKVIHVMGPAGLQAWDASWVVIADE